MENGRPAGRPRRTTFRRLRTIWCKTPQQGPTSRPLKN